MCKNTLTFVKSKTKLSDFRAVEKVNHSVTNQSIKYYAFVARRSCFLEREVRNLFLNCRLCAKYIKREKNMHHKRWQRKTGNTT